MEINRLTKTLKAEVIKASNNPQFIHHAWFVDYHLDIVEKIALELCEKYTKADKDLVQLLVWFHDYGKILDHANQYNATLTQGRDKLVELGFPKEVIEKLMYYMQIFDKKEHLQSAPIEIKIVSSADAASHMTGPFYLFFWKEFHGWDYNALLEENKRKIYIDWEKKIVLPEVKNAFQERFEKLLEQFGKLPEKYLNESSI